MPNVTCYGSFIPADKQLASDGPIMIVEFDSEAEMNAVLAAGQVAFTVFGEEPSQKTVWPLYTVRFEEFRGTKTIRVKTSDGRFINLPNSKIRNFEAQRPNMIRGYEIFVELEDWLAKDRGLMKSTPK